MKVKVELCWGSKLFSYRLTLPDGTREYIPANLVTWTNRESRKALDLLEHVYKLKRSNIRFEVH